MPGFPTLIPPSTPACDQPPHHPAPRPRQPHSGARSKRQLRTASFPPSFARAHAPRQQSQREASSGACRTAGGFGRLGPASCAGLPGFGGAGRGGGDALHEHHHGHGCARRLAILCLGRGLLGLPCRSAAPALGCVSPTAPVPTPEAGVWPAPAQHRLPPAAALLLHEACSSLWTCAASYRDTAGACSTTWSNWCGPTSSAAEVQLLCCMPGRGWEGLSRNVSSQSRH